MPRKTPILLRRGPLTGDVLALYRYRRKTLSNGKEVIDCGWDGKQSVASDFDALVLEELIGDDAPDIIGILDGAADGELLKEEYRVQLRAFERRFRAVVERHNARLEQ